MLSVTAYSIDRLSGRYFCRRNAKMKNNYMSWTKCGNTEKRATAKCWNQLIEDMFQIQNISDSKIKIPTICWSVSIIFYQNQSNQSYASIFIFIYSQFFSWKSCTMKIFQEKGPPVCSERNIDLLDKFINEGAINVLRFLCEFIYNCLNFQII